MAVILSTLNNRVTYKSLGSAEIACTLKVKKAASNDEILHEATFGLDIGRDCGHAHDCCGCVIRRLLSFRRTKKNEFVIRFYSTRNM